MACVYSNMKAPQPRGAAGRLLILGLVAAIAMIGLFVWLAGFVEDGAAIPFDTFVRAWVHGHSSPALTALMRAMSFIGEPGPLIVLSVAAFLILLRVAHWPRAALFFLVTMTGVFVVDNALKLLFHRTRPETFFGTPTPHSYSFPSGHALYSVCLWGVLAALACLRVRSLAARGAIWAGAAIVAGLTGYSRIYLGVHYPSDVIAGYAAAIAWVAAVAGADRLLRRRRQRQRAAPRIPA
jgi:undecaprenyl-diphosphatase